MSSVLVAVVLPHAKLVDVRNIFVTETTDRKGIQILLRKKPTVICFHSGTMHAIQAKAYTYGRMMATDRRTKLVMEKSEMNIQKHAYEMKRKRVVNTRLISNSVDALMYSGMLLE